MARTGKEKKATGNLGEKIAAHYLERRGFTIVDRNISRKTGELDVIAREPACEDREDTLHFVEVKTVIAEEFPDERLAQDEYDPSLNLHAEKVRKVARTAEWYVANKQWEGDWQVDGCLVWIRRRDGLARVRYLPQIV